MTMKERIWRWMFPYLTAAGAGALSFLSPCVLPLVPPYLCYMAGVTVEDFRADASTAKISPVRRALLLSSFCFVLGFTTVFVLLGAGASTIGAFLRMWQQEIAILAESIIIIMGLNFLGVFRLAFLLPRGTLSKQRSTGQSLCSLYYGIGIRIWLDPCIGPVLGPILALAGARDTVADGALLLAIYSLRARHSLHYCRAIFRCVHAIPIPVSHASWQGRKNHGRTAGGYRSTFPDRRAADIFILAA